VNIRNRDDQSTQSKGDLIPLQEALDHLVKLKEEKRRINAF
jgi:threonyl-tRNA synthetase